MAAGRLVQFRERHALYPGLDLFHAGAGAGIHAVLALHRYGVAEELAVAFRERRSHQVEGLVGFADRDRYGRGFIRSGFDGHAVGGAEALHAGGQHGQGVLHEGLHDEDIVHGGAAFVILEAARRRAGLGEG